MGKRAGAADGEAWAADAPGGGVVLRIHARPGASSSEVGGVDAWRGALTVRVTAKARDGEANAALCRLLAERLGVPTRAVTLRQGALDRDKVVHVAGVDARTARRVLGGSR